MAKPFSALFDKMSPEARAEIEARVQATLWPGDPRDLTAVEANSCLNSDDPAQHAVLKAHLDTLCDDLRAGKGLQIDSTAGLMAGIRARLGVPNLEEQERIRAFESRHYRCGGTIEVTFAMTSIGTGVRVSCTTCNETVTDYDSW